MNETNDVVLPDGTRNFQQVLEDVGYNFGVRVNENGVLVSPSAAALVEANTELDDNGVRLLKSDGTTTYFKISADTDAARGEALQAAIDAAKVRADADGADGFAFVSPLIWDGAVTFYSVATYGGISHTTKGISLGSNLFASYEGWTNGVVFKIDTASNFTVLHRFANDEIWNPQCGLVLITVGGVDYVYGVGGEGSGAGQGGVWRINLGHQVPGHLGRYELLAALTGTTGYRPYGTPVLVSGVLYFTCSHAGDNTNNDLLGTICSFNTATNTLTKLHTFDQGSSPKEGNSPNSGMIAGAAAGTFYGTCARGGDSNFGTVWKFVTGSPGTLTVLHTFTGGTDGYYPIGQLLRDGTDLIGTTKQGGTNGYGSVFKIRAITTSPAYTANWVAFTGLAGSYPGMHPVSGLIKSSDLDYYGATMEGGAANVGVVYKLAVSSIGSATATYTKITECTKLLGYYPRSNLTEVGTDLWFTTQLGGVNRGGDICYIPRSGGTTPGAAYNAPCGNANCKISVGPGTFSIDAQRFTFGQFTLEGAVKLATKLKCSDNSWHKGLFSGTWSFFSVHQSFLTSARGIHLKNLTLDCNVAGQDTTWLGVAQSPSAPGSCAMGGFNAYATESSVENVRLINLGGTGDLTYSASPSTHQIYGCFFSCVGMLGSFYELHTQSHGMVQGNRIVNCDSRWPFPESLGNLVVFRNGGDGADSLTEPGNAWSINPLISGCLAEDYDRWFGGQIFGFSGQNTAGLVVDSCGAYNLGTPTAVFSRGFHLDNHPSIDTTIHKLRTAGVSVGINVDFSGLTKPQTALNIVTCQLRARDVGIFLSAVTPQLKIVGNQIHSVLGIDSTDTSSPGVTIYGNMIDTSGLWADVDAWAIPPVHYANTNASGILLDCAAPGQMSHYKTGDQTKNSGSGAIAIDADLQVPVELGVLYKFKMAIFWQNAEATGEMRCAISAPATTFGIYSAVGTTDKWVYKAGDFTAGKNMSDEHTAVETAYLIIDGMFLPSAAGTFGFSWESQTAAKTCTLYKGSFLEVSQFTPSP